MDTDQPDSEARSHGLEARSHGLEARVTSGPVPGEPRTPPHGETSPAAPAAVPSPVLSPTPTPTPTPTDATIFCAACGYALDGLPAGRCPECGRPFDPAAPRTFAADWAAADRRRLGTAALAAGIAVLLTMALLGARDGRLAVDPIAAYLAWCGLRLRGSGRRGRPVVGIIAGFYLFAGGYHVYVAAAMLLDRLHPGPRWVPENGPRAWEPAFLALGGLLIAACGGVNLYLLAKWQRRARSEQDARRRRLR